FRFDCHSKLLTNDFRKTVKAGEYPKLTIRFLTLDHMPTFQNNLQNMKGWVEVELAGVRRTFQIEYEFNKPATTSYYLNGEKTFCFSDFKLTPPRKMAGAIKVEDEFHVEFRLKLSPLKG
ncbi:MAG: YceI family protein, partial [Flavisolibacter sp.]|nr:YceI family protein [Flavisolibacter sp.]